MKYLSFAYMYYENLSWASKSLSIFTILATILSLPIAHKVGFSVFRICKSK